MYSRSPSHLVHHNPVRSTPQVRTGNRAQLPVVIQFVSPYSFLAITSETQIFLFQLPMFKFLSSPLAKSPC